MATKQEKIAQLKKELENTLNTPTSEEFLAFAKQIIDIIQNLRKDNKATAEDLNKAFDKATKSLGDNNSTSLADVKAEIVKALDKSFKEQSGTMNLLRDKVRNIKEGVDGHTPTNTELLTLIKPLIPEPLEVEPLNLESLEEEDKLLNAKIKELDEKIDQISKQRRLGGGTGGDGNVAHSLSRLVTSETPSGAINGSNTAYTITRIPKAIMSFYINGMFIHPGEYTQSGTTITFTSALPASLSGKGFTITFV